MTNFEARRELSIMAIANDAIDNLHRSFALADSDFFCECGDNRCAERIRLNRAEYASLRNGDQPLLVASHAHRDADEGAELQDLRDVVHQLQGDVESRAMLEQAKGVLAERSGVSPGTAFQILRQRARDERRSLGEICAETVAAVERMNDEGSAEQTCSSRPSNRSSDPRGR